MSLKFFSIGVYDKVSVGEKAKWDFVEIGHSVCDKYVLDRLEKSDKEFKLIEWSATRQQWFEALETSFVRMINNIQNFMNENSNEEFQLLIDNGSTNLLGNGN